MAEDQAESKPTRTEMVARWSGRMLLFLAVALFVAFWAWYFVVVLGARQYSWAFWSLLLFALFLFALRITPSGRALRMELGLASAKVLVDYEAPIRAEDIVENFKAAVPEEVRKAVEAVKPQLVKEVTREFAVLSERAALQALASTPTSQLFTLGELGNIELAQPISVSDYISGKWPPVVRIGTPVEGEPGGGGGGNEKADPGGGIGPGKAGRASRRP